MSKIINTPAVVLTILIIALLLAVSIFRLQIDMDIIGTLPQSDSVIADARDVIVNHPIQDQLVIDLGIDKSDPDMLVQAGELIERQLTASGLFEQVGMDETRHLVPQMMIHIIDHLPVMFSQKELERNISPLLTPTHIKSKLQDNLRQLAAMDGIGQARFIAADPLGIKDSVMARLIHLAPSGNARIYKDHLLSEDGRHLLITARPHVSGTDSRFARQAARLFISVQNTIDQKYRSRGYQFILTPMGAYRAALDNETMARSDVRRAILFSTIGIALLLLAAFPRPYIGILALLPALAGSVGAFFVYSLFHPSISMLTLGFGGAIISITVDHGIIYLLFLDRPYQTSGNEVAHEVRAIGLLATLTTVGAFSALSFSGFPILAQVGQFAALGIALAFIFVHTVFPLIFPNMPPARRHKRPFLQQVTDALALKGGNTKVYIASGFALCMLFFAKPQFHIDLNSMNSVSDATKAAEQLLADVWGDIFSKIHIVTISADLEELHTAGDRLTGMLETDMEKGVLASAFHPAMIFPGQERCKQNLTAWHHFWNADRKAEVVKTVRAAALELGFAEDAFEPFFQSLTRNTCPPDGSDEPFFTLLGISQKSADGGWMQFASLTPGKSYRPDQFYTRYTSEQVKIFDPQYFSMKLGAFLSATFSKMVLIITVSVVILLALFFWNWKLTVIALLPLVFAFICTLGTLNLMGRPLDIPSLMLAIVILGMGIDYSLFFVRAHQRYQKPSHPSMGLIRMGVFLASASTLIGFGTLSLAQHTLLQSAGLTTFLGVGYAVIGAFTILPPLLDRVRLSEE
ncbi:MMPL family transporter [Desulfococcaceae bacterium HSG9]|nr:MMPL family transporter [Desulfococcaceae bacterium HSG9]